MGGSFKQAVGDEIQGGCLTDTLIFEVDDDSVGAVSFEADDDFLVSEVGGRLITDIVEGEGIVLFDFSAVFGEEELVIEGIRREESDAFEVKAETVDGSHADGGVLSGVVVVLDPLSKLTVEGVKRGEIELPDKELIADGAA